MSKKFECISFPRNSIQITTPLARMGKRSTLSPVSPTVNYKTLRINYQNIVDQVITHYSVDNFNPCPMTVQFIYANKEVEKKSSVDMFMAFWQFTFERYFIGSHGSYVPRVDLNGDCLRESDAIALGKIIAHGFNINGYLPLYGICKASLVYCLTGGIPSEKLLLESYIKSIDEDYQQSIETALIFINSRSFFSSKIFPKEMENDLMEFFHESGLKAIPRVENLKTLLLKSALHYCIEKPHFILANFRKGVLELNPNWENLSEEMACVFLSTCHNTGQCQPIFGDDDHLNMSDDGGSVRSRSSSRSSLFGRH